MLDKGDIGANDAAHPLEGGPAEAGGLTASSLPLLDCADICHCLPPDRTRHKVNVSKVDYSGDLGKGGGASGMRQTWNPAGLCWSSTHLVQWGPDERSWYWIQIWVQARMPSYSLNCTATSSGIQGWHRCQWCSPPTRKWPSQCRGPYGLKLAIVGLCPNLREGLVYTEWKLQHATVPCGLRVRL